MYGIPENLDINQFIDLKLSQICIGASIIHFKFESSRIISIEGNWELKNSSGVIIDQNISDTEKNSDKEYYKLHLLLEKKVISGTIESPKYFSLIFEENYELKLFDDSTKFESISIQPSGIVI